MRHPRFLLDKGRTWLRPFCFALLLCAPAYAREVRVTILHFSDYHSHAVPFYDDGWVGQGGIARAIGFMWQEKKRGAIVFSGGDMVNKGSPAWSDKYQCAEWPWFNGIVDAMAFGNHDADYGRDSFEKCRSQLRYPILSANTAGMQTTVVVTAHGARVGAFALAGSDFTTLVKAEGFTFGDRIAAARDAVRELREQQHVDAVVMIGHEHLDDDFALARAVPGIDLILGTHSHLKRELTRIDGTDTWFISPGQYLTFVSRVELTIDDRKVTRVDGKLVRVDEHLPLDKTIAKRVKSMQRALEHDPAYSPLFQPIARLAQAMSVEQLSARTVEIMRSAAKADVAISTASSFRQPLPPGVVTLEDLRAALPYDNEIVVVEMSGTQLRKLLDASSAEEALVATKIDVDPAKVYRVAVTDYLANVAARYRDFFASLPNVRTSLHVRNEVRISFEP